MIEQWLVVDERDADEPRGAIHVQSFMQEGRARAKAADMAREKPGRRVAIFRYVDVCEASVTPALWSRGDVSNDD